MVRFLSILMCAFCATIAGAQLLPIELDQTITLPVGTNIWDVMPHPDGYYLWVAAIDPDTDQTRIYWGRTDVGGFDSLDFDVGRPQSITCFWRDNYVPCVVLFSRRYQSIGERDLLRIYRLPDASPDTASWSYYGSLTFWSPYHQDLRYDFRTLAIAENPAPPQISSRVSIMVSHTYEGVYDYGQTHSFTYPCHFIMNMLADASSQTWALPGNANNANCTMADDTIRFVYSGRHYFNGWNSSVRSFNVPDDSVRVPILTSCSGSGDCISSLLAATWCQPTRVIYCFTQLPTLGIVSVPVDTIPVWTIPHTYSFWMSADVIPNNCGEEFLAYSNAGAVFHIYGAADGHDYGVSTQVGLLSSDARIISRYDSTYRRIAWRTGAHDVRLYRFGEYLAAVDNSATVPLSFSLSSHPNPFNPASTISLSLPHEQAVRLTVFDITGREVETLVNETMPSGEHRVIFDGARLSSGIYFAHLSAGSETLTQKLLLVR